MNKWYQEQNKRMKLTLNYVSIETAQGTLIRFPTARAALRDDPEGAGGATELTELESKIPQNHWNVNNSKKRQ